MWWISWSEVESPAGRNTESVAAACLPRKQRRPTTLSIVHEAPKEQATQICGKRSRLELTRASRRASYQFLHDRVQEAAYSLIPAELRAEAISRIGRLLAAHTPPEKREEAIFEIVNQLNRGAALITSREERDRIAELNLIAGKRAKVSTAYASALKYFRRRRRTIDQTDSVGAPA